MDEGTYVDYTVHHWSTIRMFVMSLELTGPEARTALEFLRRDGNHAVYYCAPRPDDGGAKFETIYSPCQVDWTGFDDG